MYQRFQLKARAYEQHVLRKCFQYQRRGSVIPAPSHPGSASDHKMSSERHLYKAVQKSKPICNQSRHCPHFHTERRRRRGCLASGASKTYGRPDAASGITLVPRSVGRRCVSRLLVRCGLYPAAATATVDLRAPAGRRQDANDTPA